MATVNLDHKTLGAYHSQLYPVQTTLFTLKIMIIEGLRAKRAYMAFLADFHFLQDRANFWQTDLF